jgi:hypothetical protein
LPFVVRYEGWKQRPFDVDIVGHVCDDKTVYFKVTLVFYKIQTITGCCARVWHFALFVFSLLLPLAFDDGPIQIETRVNDSSIAAKQVPFISFIVK